MGGKKLIRNTLVSLFVVSLFALTAVSDVSAAACPKGQLKDPTGVCYDPCKVNDTLLNTLMMYETPAKKKQITKLLAKCKSN